VSLTVEEQQRVDEIGFETAVALLIKDAVNRDLERARAFDGLGNEALADGLSIAVKDGDEAERIINQLREPLQSRGYRVFWSKRHDPDGMVRADELVFLRTSDPNAIIHLRASNGANVDITTEDILERLAAWRELAEFTVVGADHDWVALQFTRLPDRLCAFAEEVYSFCPDTVEQGVGLIREKREPERFREARELCPEIVLNPMDQHREEFEKIESMPAELLEMFQDPVAIETSRMGIRLLAHDIKKRKYLFLWWD
jgi:hypothetical protein